MDEHDYCPLTEKERGQYLPRWGLMYNEKLGEAFNMGEFSSDSGWVFRVSVDGSRLSIG